MKRKIVKIAAKKNKEILMQISELDSKLRHITQQLIIDATAQTRQESTFYELLFNAKNQLITRSPLSLQSYQFCLAAQKIQSFFSKRPIKIMEI